MSEWEELLHNAVVKRSPNSPRSLYLTNVGEVPVHLTKMYVAGTATAYNGPLHVVKKMRNPWRSQRWAWAPGAFMNE